MTFRRGFLMLILSLALAIALVSQVLAGELSGTVSYLERIAVPPKARLRVELRDVSLADAPAPLVAAAEYPLFAVPARYHLSFADQEILPGHSYAVSARISAQGKLLFVTDTIVPVLQNRTKDHADFLVRSLSTAD